MNGSPNWFKNILRSLFSALDSFGYWILGGVYNIFFAVSSAEIISGDVVREFFGRVQLILGVIMVFKLTFTVLSIIINPDVATDKQKGAGKILTRIAAALVMLTLVVPINIPDAADNTLNGRINDHGILFGFLYQFQDSVVKENIFGKLILGSRAEYNTENENGSMNAGGEIDNMADIGGVMAATVTKAFVTPTILSDADETDIGSLSEIETDSGSNTNDDTISGAVSDIISGATSVVEGESNNSEEETGDSNTVDASTVFACTDTPAYNYYSNPNAAADGILYYLNETCDSEDGEVYVFNYTLLGGLICSIIMTIIILGFTIDVAVRAIKLAVLRLIAPIPIISYISPGSEKDGAFGNWVKTLISTYLDLFVRLVIIYFGAYLILLVSQSLGGGGVNIIQTDYGFVTNVLATVFIIIGILVFMKQAPKFFKDMLGLKGTPMGNAGLSGMIGGIAAFAGGAGLAGAGAAALSGLNAGAEAAAQGKSAGLGWAQGRDLAAQIRTGDPKARGGLVNNLSDRLMRSAGISRARKIYGVTATGVNEAQQKMFDAQREAAVAHNIESRVRENGWAGLSDSERNIIEEFYRRENGIGQGALSEAQVEEMQNQGATLYAYSKDSAYAKAESAYKKVNQFADSHRISPSFEEKYRRTVSESIYDKYAAVRHPIQTFKNYANASNRRGEHPGVLDRLGGNGKWSEQGGAAANLNRYQDNPNRDMDTPQAGGGSGPHH